MSTETENRTAVWDARTEIERVKNSANVRADMLGIRLQQLSERLDALEQARAAEPQPLPASPAPVEPAPAPETPEQTAARLLSDPEALALFMNTVAGANGNERQALADELMRLPFDVRCSNGLRLLAATIAAGSFRK